MNKVKRSVLFLGAGLLASTLVAIETRVKGGRMELLNKGSMVRFSHGVVMERGTDRLSSDLMETTKAKDKIMAKGNVALFRRVSAQETWKGFGHKGFYNTKKGEGFLEGGKKKAHLIYKGVVSSTATQVMEIFAVRFDFNEKDSGAKAHKRVYGKTVDPDTGDMYEFWSERADYFGEEKKVVLSGPKPSRVVRYTEGTRESVRGDVITYYLDSKRFVAEGEAQAVFVDKKTRKK